MLEAIKHLSSEYFRYVDTLRAIPSCMDCFKPVERRVLLATHEIAKNNFVKSATIVGHTMKRWHPHGNTAIYESLVSLANRGFVDKQGNFGRLSYYKDNKAAAERYTEVKTNKFIDNSFSELLDFVEYRKIEMDEEPIHLPSPIPLGLIGDWLTIGIGGVNTTKIPQFRFEDLFKRLKSLLNNKPEKIIPFINGCDILEKDNDIEKILTTGKGTIICSPKIEKIIDEDGDEALIIYGRNPLTGFGNVDNVASEDTVTKTNTLAGFNTVHELKNGVPYFIINDIKDFTSGTKVLIKVKLYKTGKKKVLMTDETITLIKRLINKEIHINVYCVGKDNAIRIFSIDELLMISYNQWKSLILKKFQYEINQLNNNLYSLDILTEIKKVFKKNGFNIKIEELYDIINKKFKDLEFNIFKDILNKKNISSLLNTDIDKTPLLEKKEILLNNINNIDEFCYKKLENDYGN